MDEMQSILKRIETNQDDLDAWQRLGELVVEPGKKNDCRDQVTRIKNKRFGFNAVIRCEQCGASMTVLPKNENGHTMVFCPVCRRTKEPAGDLKQFGDAAKTISFDENSSTPVYILNSRLTFAAIIASNLLPFFGILFMSWSLFSVLLLYWIENVIVSFFTALKLCFVDADRGRREQIRDNWILLCQLLLFCLVHGVVLMAIFLPPKPGTRQWLTFQNELALPVVVLFIIYGIDFVKHYLRGGIYKFAKPITLMYDPYKRIMLMTSGLILGGLLTKVLGSPIWIILVLITFKTGMDVLAYLNSTARWRAQAEVEA